MTLPARTFLVGVHQEHNGQPLYNVLCFVHPGAGAPNETDLAIDLQTNWELTNSFADCQVQDVLYIDTAVKRLDTDDETLVIPWDSGLTGHGNVVGDPVDPGSCLGFSLRTGVAGKSNRGRMYLGGVGRGGLDSFSTSWDLTTSPGSTFKNAGDVFNEAMQSSDNVWDWSVYSRKLQTATSIFQAVCRSSILSQNPRARRYGSL